VLKINRRDGRTLTFDLLTVEGLDDWVKAQGDPKFQSQISGAGILHDGVLHVLTIPQGFRTLSFEAEVLYRKNGDGTKVAGERLTCYADHVRLTVTVHHGSRPKVAKYSTARVGRMRYNPALHGPVRKERDS